MITIIFAVFAVICLVFIAYLLNQKWELDKYNDKLQSRLAFAGKDYIEMRNKLNEEITLLKTKINEKKKTSISNSKKPKKIKGRRIPVRNSRKDNS